MAAKKMGELLNQAIAREIAVSIQYMWQHVMVKGLYAQSVGPVFRQIALTEMLHAEMIAERLDYLGGKPTTEPATINVGGSDPEAMLKLDVKAEEEALALYREIIELAQKEGDYTTRKLFEDILRDEENHHNTFLNLLGK
ncbi:MAG: ferritin-like domain-containing protein [Nitrospirota bacterium]|jgi:bacterioferritin